MEESIRVAVATRDALADIARDELGGVSLDEALRVLIFEYQTRRALQRLRDDPEALGEYLTEGLAIAESALED